MPALSRCRRSGRYPLRRDLRHRCRHRYLLGTGKGPRALRPRTAGVFGHSPGLRPGRYRRRRRTTGARLPRQLSAPEAEAANRMSQGKPVRESASEYSELALPNDANGLGHVLGGKVMHLVDLAGAMAGMRHARRPIVTASVDHMNFLYPVRIGQLIILRSSVNRVFHTSMEIGVRVMVED